MRSREIEPHPEALRGGNLCRRCRVVFGLRGFEGLLKIAGESRIEEVTRRKMRIERLDMGNGSAFGSMLFVWFT